jgi:hypothetical protein
MKYNSDGKLQLFIITKHLTLLFNQHKVELQAKMSEGDIIIMDEESLLMEFDYYNSRNLSVDEMFEQIMLQYKLKQLLKTKET